MTMSRFLHCIVFILLPFIGFSQYAGNANDWVDFSKKYYKVSVNTDGIVQVNAATLQAAGLPAASAIGSDFQVFYNGAEIPIYVSTNGAFSSNDFIEFLGRHNDGVADTPLYENPDWQPNQRTSLFTDEADYYITTNPGASNLRMANINNNLTGLPAKEEYAIAKAYGVTASRWGGRSYPIGGSTLFDSRFEEGEGLISQRIISTKNFPIPTPGVYSVGNLPVTLNATIFKQVGTTSSNSVQFKLGSGNQVSHTWNTNTNDLSEPFTDTFDASDMTAGTTTFNVVNGDSSQRYNMLEMEVIYPRDFNFSGEDFIEFDSQSSGSKYFEIENMNSGSGTLVAYDLSSLERIEFPHAAVAKLRSSATAGNLFAIDNSIDNITSAEEIQFTDYAAINADFVVIYHPALTAPVGGVDYVQEYINYRQSPTGGSHVVAKANILDLYDQFSYGITGHASAIKNFLKELSDQGSNPEHVFIIGKGYEYTSIISTPSLSATNYVPAYGHPGSDNLYASDYFDLQMRTAMGRLAARSPAEVKIYYDKVIEYESFQNDFSDAAQTKDKIWMKEALHLGGGANSAEQNVFRFFLENYEEEIESLDFGAKVTSVFKTSTDPIQLVESIVIDSLIDRGLSLVTFFGHASPNVFEFNLRDPGNYENQGRYPIIVTNGCYVGNLFNPNTETLSEEFVLEPNKGAVGFMGPIQFGIAQGMNNYTQRFYENISVNNYDGSVGSNIANSLNASVTSSIISQLTSEQMIFHGDPSLRLNSQPKPDYLVTDEDITFIPNIITADVDSFDVVVNLFNIGRAKNETVDVTLTRILPDGTEEAFTQTVSPIYYNQEITFRLRTDAIETAGLNSFNVFIDDNDALDEITRANNGLAVPITKTIISNTVTPVFPYDFAITNDTDVELKASSVQIYDVMKNFQFQIDTTELFNSPLLENGTVSSIGGLVSWNPSISMTEGQVYYWRTKIDEPNSIWRNSSFVYLSAYQSGWNQSHYYQWLQDDFASVSLGTDRNFNFASSTRNITLRTGVSPTVTNNEKAYFLDGDKQFKYRCNAEFVVAVFDGNSGIPWENQRQNHPVGEYDSYFCNPNLVSMKAFNYRTNNAAERKKLMDFLDVIPAGNYVMVYSQKETNSIAHDWASDTGVYGYNLFDKFNQYGGSASNTLADDAPYMLFFRKGSGGFDPAYAPTEVVGVDNTTIIDEVIFFNGNWSIGQMTSPVIGPSAGWDEFQWDWDSSLDNDATGDATSYDIIGIQENGNFTTLFTNQTASTLDLSSVSATTYPFIQLVWHVQDPNNFTAAQMNYWRIIYESPPELAIKADLLFDVTDTDLPRGKPLEFTFGLENISTKDMTPVLVEYVNSYPDNTKSTTSKRYADLDAGESITIDHTFDTNCECAYGINSMLIDANPNNDQLEQYHFNNVAVIRYEVEKDNANPYLDVTFDGIHIIDGDIVSEDPNIVISLVDENLYLALNEGEDFKIVLDEPNVDTLTTFTELSPEVTFYPANPNDLSDNRAVIEFNPNLVPGEYSMIVQGKDISNNNAGNNDYKISFVVTEDDVITRIVNYPNPFSTRTEFVANIIGDAPDYILIQIFSPTGRVIREIKSSPDLISVSQGNNFFKIAEWDGTDEYGDPVGNGLYYYKVTMKRNGEVMDPIEDKQYDPYFYNGLGKLYILR